jgi:hypothetical protein
MTDTGWSPEPPWSAPRGTVQITGSDAADGIALTITKTVGITVSIPAK